MEENIKQSKIYNLQVIQTVELQAFNGLFSFSGGLKFK